MQKAWAMASLSFPPCSFPTFLGFISIIPAENRLSLYDEITKDGQRQSYPNRWGWHPLNVCFTPKEELPRLPLDTVLSGHLRRGAMLRPAWGPHISLSSGLLEVEVELESSEGQNREDFTRKSH